VVRLFILLVGLASVARDVRAVSADGDSANLFATPISHDFEVVTQVSNTRPFVGEQFFVIYSLRSLKTPAAVELDPQQYSGFWTEPAPLPEQPRSTVRLRNGRQVSEYLLRQVMAFPLWSGTLELPPLRVKVKSNDSRAISGDWDIIGLSRPVTVVVRGLVPDRRHEGLQPLVGELEGSVSADSSGGRPDLLLELKGTANLALFQPAQWLQTSNRIRWSVRLKGWDNTIQTRDTGEGRRLTLLQWRRWSIHPLTGRGENVRLEDLAIPVFQPGRGQWSTVRVAGLDFKNRASVWPEEIAAEDLAPDGTGLTNGVSPYIMYTALVLSGLAICLLAIRLRHALTGTGRET
jgi:hypothetical protein